MFFPKKKSSQVKPSQAKPSTKERYCCFRHQDFWTKYFFFLRYDDVYRAEGHTEVDICVKQS